MPCKTLRVLAFAAGAACSAALGDDPGARPLQVESREGKDSLAAEVRGVVDAPFAAAAALDKPARWCEILMLHLNTKSCSLSEDGAILHVASVRRYDQPASAAQQIAFAFHAARDAGGSLRVALDADAGPMGTRDYRMVVVLAPTPEGRTSVHMTYAYSFGTMARIAMQGYVSTSGRDKVGFTVVGREPGGEPLYIDGMRGVVERNTMRYFLAVEAYLVALSAQPQARKEASLQGWHSGVERYARQLHEMEREDYLAMKRAELK